MGYEGDPGIYNNLFVDRVADPSTRTKIAQDTSDLLREEILEHSIRDAAWEPDYNPKRIQEALDNDSFYVLDRYAHEFEAVDLNLSGEPNGDIIRNRKFATPIIKIESDKYKAKLDELRMLEYSVKDEFRENIAFYIARRQDILWLNQLKVAADYTGYHDSLTVSTVDKATLIAPCEFVDGGGTTHDSEQEKALKSEIIIIHQWMVDQIEKMDNADINMGSWETIKDGWKSTTLFGRRLLVTSQTFFPKNRIWGLTSKKYGGTVYVLPDGDTKVMFDTDLDDLVALGKKLTGSGIHNVYCCAYVDVNFS